MVNSSGGSSPRAPVQGDASAQADVGADILGVAGNEGGLRLYATSKPPKYDDEGGMDLYEALLKSYLMQRKCWGVVDGSETRGRAGDDARRVGVIDAATFDVKNAVARDAILRGLPPKDAMKVCTLQTAREMWTAFEAEKTKRSFANALYIRKKLYSATYSADMDMDTEKYLDEMELMPRQLRNMNDEISDDEMVKVLLQGVAYEYRNIVQLYGKAVREGNPPSLVEVLNTLRSEAEIDKQRREVVKAGKAKPEAITQMQRNESAGDKRSKQQGGPGKKKFKGNGKQRETRECFYCKKPGHLKRDCRALKKKKEEEAATAATSTSGDAKNTSKPKSMSLMR